MLVPNVKLLSTSMSWTGAPYVSEIMGTRLSLEGLLLPVALVESQTPETPRIMTLSPLEADIGTCDLDIPGRPLQTVAYCFRFATIEINVDKENAIQPVFEGSHVVLILEPLTDSDHYFKRISISTLEITTEKGNPMADASTSVVHLV
jgi:hypothetical protein